MLAKYVFVATMSCLGVTSLGRAADTFPADADFVRKAARSGNQEIADARGALAMSKDPAIQELAKRIEEDGTSANRRLAALEIEKGWPTPAVDPPYAMSPYSDHRYIVRQIRAQLDALKFYTQEADDGADTALQEFARGTVPILRQRLASLRSVRSS
jgi:predicted outer membrane protein